MLIRLGLIARWPPDAEGDESLPRDAYKSRVVPMEQIIRAMPWDEAPESLREIALDQWKSYPGPCSLVILRTGKVMPAPWNVHRRWARVQEQQRQRGPTARRRRPKASVEAGLRAAGWATVQDVAEDTGYCEDHLRLLARERKIVAQKVDRRWWIHRRSLDIYVRRGGGPRGPRKEIR